MAEQRFIVEHPDGRRYSVTQEGFDAVYRDQGFTIAGEETAADLVPSVPRPPRGRRSSQRRRDRAARHVAPTPASAPPATEDDA